MTTLILPPAKPLLTNVVAPYNPQLISVAAALVANVMVWTRVTIPYSGVLHDISVPIGTHSGNCILGIFDTSATTRNQLYTSGSVAPGSDNTWYTAPTDPALTVSAGDELDFALVADNATMTFGRCATLVAAALSQMPTGFWPSPLGGSNRIYASKAASFPLPATVSEATLATASAVPCIIARLTPS